MCNLTARVSYGSSWPSETRHHKIMMNIIFPDSVSRYFNEQMKKILTYVFCKLCGDEELDELVKQQAVVQVQYINLMYFSRLIVLKAVFIESRNLLFIG